MNLQPAGPLSYIGQISVPYIVRPFAPNSTNNEFNVPTMWVDSSVSEVYILVSKPLGSATWVNVTSNLIGHIEGTDNQIDVTFPAGIAKVALDAAIITPGTVQCTDQLSVTGSSSQNLALFAGTLTAQDSFGEVFGLQSIPSATATADLLSLFGAAVSPQLHLNSQAARTLVGCVVNPALNGPGTLTTFYGLEIEAPVILGGATVTNYASAILVGSTSSAIANSTTLVVNGPTNASVTNLALNVLGTTSCTDQIYVSGSSQSALINAQGTITGFDGFGEVFGLYLSPLTTASANIRALDGIAIEPQMLLNNLVSLDLNCIYADANVVGPGTLDNYYGLHVFPVITSGAPTILSAYSVYADTPGIGGNRFAGYFNGLVFIAADNYNAEILSIGGTISTQSFGNASAVTLSPTIQMGGATGSAQVFKTLPTISLTGNSTTFTSELCEATLSGAHTLATYIGKDIYPPGLGGGAVVSQYIGQRIFVDNTATTNYGLQIGNTGTGVSLNVDNTATGIGINVDVAGGIGVQIGNSGSAVGLLINNSSTGVGINVAVTTSTTDAIQVNGGIKVNPTTGVSGASPLTANNRFFAVSFTGVNIPAGNTQSFVVNNSLVTTGSQLLPFMTGATTGAAPTLQSWTAGAGTITFTVTNGTGATAQTNNLNFYVWVLN